MEETGRRPDILNIYRLNPCPRCKSNAANEALKKSTSFKNKLKKGVICCPDCGLTINRSTSVAAAQEWDISREKRIQYAFRVLKENGNAFIGDLSGDEWEEDELKDYIKENTGLNIEIDSPQSFEGGFILRVV